MTLRLWNELHKDLSMSEQPKNKTVLVKTNIGTNDLRTFGIQEAYQEGDVVDLNADSADRMIRARVAVEYTDEVKKEVEAQHKTAHDAAISAALPIARRDVAIEEAKEEAKKKLKEGPVVKKEAAPKGASAVQPPDAGAPVLKDRAAGAKNP